MPRSTETPKWRRLAEQVIMWLVLAGTVGMAALINVDVGRLGSPQSIDGVTLRLPRWRPTENHGPGVIELQETGQEILARTITVRPLTLDKGLAAVLSPGAAPLEQVDLAEGGAARISVIRRSLERQFNIRGLSEIELLAVVTPPSGRPLMISLKGISFADGGDVDVNLRLMRRILESIRFTGQPPG
jgi:hypothetical protein